MAKIYLIETKEFSSTYNGLEVQDTDMGKLPYLFTSFKRARQQMKICRQVHTEMFDETIVKDYRLDEIPDENCHDRFETRHNVTGARTIVSLYEVETL